MNKWLWYRVDAASWQTRLRVHRLRSNILVVDLGRRAGRTASQVGRGKGTLQSCLPRLIAFTEPVHLSLKEQYTVDSKTRTYVQLAYEIYNSLYNLFFCNYTSVDVMIQLLSYLYNIKRTLFVYKYLIVKLYMAHPIQVYQKTFHVRETQIKIVQACVRCRI